MIKEDFTPIYVDGIVELHKQFYKACLDALKLASEITPIPTEEVERIRSTRRFCIYVDSTDLQTENTIKGYFMFGKKIYRFLNITFDYALLYPVRNHRRDGFKKNMIPPLEELYHMTTPYIIYFSAIKYRNLTDSRTEEIPENEVYFKSQIRESSNNCLLLPVSERLFSTNYIDDIGKPFHKFPDISHLSLCDVPQELLDAKYSLVGKQFYAPRTTKEPFFCVLYAETENEYDPNAIKVLRWFPGKKGTEIDKELGLGNPKDQGSDYFFELGHISRQENFSLHQFMVDNDSQLLFAKCEDDKISIIGGIKDFQTNDYKYPLCLYNIPVR